ncbi:MAG: IS1634 family transposase [Candidatus Desulfaltia sp.]|nr:IS1634 family transposase [Candidatus Desulfaltia sp.]
MFLKKSKKSYKEKGYETYALTESYREGSKVKHKHIANLGTLTPEQAQRIRLVLKAQKLEDAFVGHLSDVVAKQHYRFLDVAVQDSLWRQFELDRFFDGIPYAEAMAVNRCLDPKTKIHIKRWAEATVLPRLLGIDFPDEFEIYRTLDKIADQEAALQKHLYQQYTRLGLTAENTVFYDITSSYFEGTKCVLVAYGYSRDHRPDRKQVVIALIITPEGYPLYWQVMPGNTQDVTTVEELLCKIKERFGIEECLLVFDRGMVSAHNLDAISGQMLTYVSALDKDEIRTLGILEPEFPGLLAGSWQEQLFAQGFYAYDEKLFYREHFLDKHYVIAFNRQLYQEQQQSREERLQKTKDFIASYNEELSQAQKSRNQKTTENKIANQLRKWQMHKVISWQLEPVTMIIGAAKGNERKVNTFRVVYTINETKLKEQEYLDGILCFVTNDSTLTAKQVIGHYRKKNKIEDAFREIKSYLRLRPFHLTREKRVKAHVTICVLGYLLLNALEEKLSRHEESPSGPSALELFSQCLLNRIGPKGSESYVESITEITPAQAELLKSLGLGYLVGKNYLDKILEHSAM